MGVEQVVSPACQWPQRPRQEPSQDAAFPFLLCGGVSFFFSGLGTGREEEQLLLWLARAARHLGPVSWVCGGSGVFFFFFFCTPTTTLTHTGLMKKRRTKKDTTPGSCPLRDGVRG